MALFTAIKTEVYIGSAWVDITPDILFNPPPRVTGMGIQGSSIMDRVGGVGTYTFSLDNSQKNSAGTLGYYTPQGANRLTGWDSGLPIRLYFEYDGFRRYRFYGKIDRDGIEVVTGSTRERIINVRCSNWMKDASTTLLDLPGYQTNLLSMWDPATGVNSAAYLALSNMAYQPEAVSYPSSASVSFTTAFDNSRSSTTIIGELSKIVMCEMGLMYMRGSESSGANLVLEYKGQRAAYYAANPTGSTIPVSAADCTFVYLMEDGFSYLNEDGTTFYLLEASEAATFTDTEIEEMNVGYGVNYYNQVKFITYPRKVDTANVVLYNIESPIKVLNGETLTNIRGDFRDPNNKDAKANGKSMIAPVATTDYLAFANADGTGTNYTANITVTATYGTADVKYTIVNNAGVDVYVTFLQARGRGIYFYDTTEKLFNNTAKQTVGIVKLEIDLPYIDTLTQLLTLGASEAAIWTDLLNGVANIEMNISRLSFTANVSNRLMMAFMFLEPSWLINISETVSNPTAGSYYSSPWFIQGYDFEIIDGKYVKVNYELKWNGRQ